MKLQFWISGSVIGRRIDTGIQIVPCVVPLPTLEEQAFSLPTPPAGQQVPMLTNPRKHQLPESPEQQALFSNKKKRSNPMDVEITSACDRCNAQLSSLQLTCSGCARIFHDTCRLENEEIPSSAPGSRWKCRICSAEPAAMSARDFMSMIDKLPFDNDFIKFFIHLTTRIHALERQVRTLEACPRRVIDCAAPTESQSTQPATGDGDQTAKRQHSKSVLVIGDKILKQLQPRILDRLPRKNSVAIRTYSRADSASTVSAIDSFLKENPQPVQVILHAGYEECMEFNKGAFLDNIRTLGHALKENRPDCALSVITVPQFHQECKAANDSLIANQKEWNLDVIDMTHPHRQIVHKGMYTYTGCEDVKESIATAVARKASTFLGIKMAKKRPPIQPSSKQSSPVEQKTRRSSSITSPLDGRSSEVTPLLNLLTELRDLGGQLPRQPRVTQKQPGRTRIHGARAEYPALREPPRLPARRSPQSKTPPPPTLADVVAQAILANTQAGSQKNFGGKSANPRRRN